MVKVRKSTVGKKRGNQTYYYLVESARVDGKPRIVAQEYLGSAQEPQRLTPILALNYSAVRCPR
jgi:hypothetical protein